MVNTTSWFFNPMQLSTWDQARALAAQMETFRQQSGIYLGGGVAPETSDVNTSGIFVPSWDGGPGGFPEPTGTDGGTQTFFLHFRFNNGHTGLNVGLILDKLKRYGGNQMYVFYSLNGDLYS
jgi:hypothetical protein